MRRCCGLHLLLCYPTHTRRYFQSQKNIWLIAHGSWSSFSQSLMEKLGEIHQNSWDLKSSKSFVYVIFPSLNNVAPLVDHQAPAKWSRSDLPSKIRPSFTIIQIGFPWLVTSFIQCWNYHSIWGTHRIWRLSDARDLGGYLLESWTAESIQMILKKRRYLTFLGFRARPRVKWDVLLILLSRFLNYDAD